jgi:hypothetical protein
MYCYSLRQVTSRKRTCSRYQQMAMQSPVGCTCHLAYCETGLDKMTGITTELIFQGSHEQKSKDVWLGRFLKETWLYLPQTVCGIQSILEKSCQMFLALMTRNELLKFPNVKLWATYPQRCHSYKRSGDSRCIIESQGKSPCQKWHCDIREQFRGKNWRKKKVVFVRLNGNEMWRRI